MFGLNQTCSCLVFIAVGSGKKGGSWALRTFIPSRVYSPLKVKPCGASDVSAMGAAGFTGACQCLQSAGKETNFLCSRRPATLSAEHGKDYQTA